MAHTYPTRRTYRILSVCLAIITAAMVPFAIAGVLPTWVSTAGFVIVVFWGVYGTYVWRATKPQPHRRP